MSVSPATDLARVQAALCEAQTATYERGWSMPSAMYRDPEVLALERERLFQSQWIGIGRREEVAHPGDYMALSILDEPVVVVHGADGILRAFSNVCRHRGMLITEGKGNGKSLTCPYHHWSYDHGGKLLVAPRIPPRPDFDTKSCRLPEFALEEWMGFLFVSLAPNPAPLAPTLAGLEAMVRPYHLEQTTLRYVADEVWPTNWKCMLENYLEGYHLSSLHLDTLHKVNPTRLCRHLPPGDAYFAYGVGFDPSLPRTQKGHPDLTPDEAADCIMFAIPPGFAVGLGADYSSFICIQPEAVDRVRVKLGLIFYGPDWPQETVDWAVELFKNTMMEDKVALVGLAKGLRSRFYDRGPLSPANYEGTIADFYRYLGRHMC